MTPPIVAASSYQLIRFGVVGGVATIVYFVATRSLQYYAGLSTPTAASISFALVVALNYVLHYAWTFRSSEPHLRTLPRFLGTSFGGLAINYVAVLGATSWLQMSQSEGLLLGVGLVVMWNYLLARFWVFVDRS